jgi:hypothetical protein
MGQKALNLLETFTCVCRSRKLALALIIANIFFLALPASAWNQSNPAARQQQEKIVVKHSAPLNEPIEIIEASVKTKAIKLGEGFESEPEWLKGVTFKVRNRSDKAITFVQIDLDFPETKEAAGAIMMHQLFLGQRPDFKSTLKNPPLHLKPNETIEISLEKEYAEIKRLIELKHPSVDVINKLVIRTNDMMFEDGILYAGGFHYRRNPDSNNRQKWIQIVDAQDASSSN